MRARMHWIFGFLTVLLVLLIGFAKPSQAKIVKVDKFNTDFSKGNKLVLFKEPDIKEFRVTTNIPSSRVEFRTDKKKYGAFQQQYDYKYLTIKNVTPKDEVTVYYKNVGTYERRPIDMKMTFSNMNSQYNPYLGDKYRGQIDLQISESPFSGYVFYGMSHGTITYSFYDSQTGQILNIDGNSFLTFNSLNGYPTADGQEGEFYNYLNYDVSRNDSPVDVYVTNDTNVALRSNPNLAYTSPVFIGVSNDFEDKLGSPTFTRNSASFQIQGQYHKFVFGAGQYYKWRNTSIRSWHGTWQAPSSAVLFTVTAPAPKKSVQDDQGNDITGGKVYGNDDITYRIEQPVHILGQDILEKYNSMVIKDDLPDEVEYKTARLVDEDGHTVKDAGTFDYDSKNHRVTYTASNDFLKNKMKYNGESYFVEIDAKVKDLYRDHDIQFSNQASSTVNGITKYSNRVTNTLTGYLAKINLKKVQIYTNPASEGLPVIATLDYKLLSAKRIEDYLSNTEVQLTIKNKDTNQDVLTRRVTLDKLDNWTLESVIGSSHLKTDNVSRYEVKLSRVRGRGISIGNSVIELDGHTSKEGQLIPNSSDGRINFTGVAMTEREFGQDMREYRERIQVNYTPKQRVKAGYGFGMNAEVFYESEIPKTMLNRLNVEQFTDIKSKMDSDLVDKSFISNIGQKGNDTLTMNLVRTNEDTSKGVIARYELPEVFMDRKSGSLYLNKSDITGEAVPAGHKLYTPVWMGKLGTYDVALKSQSAIGSHRMRFELPVAVNVIAYMFHHTDSHTANEDELLIQPIQQEDIPDGF